MVYNLPWKPVSICYQNPRFIPSFLALWLSADHEVVSSNPNKSSSQTFFSSLIHCFGDHAGTRQRSFEGGCAKNDLLLELAFSAELTDT